MKRTSVLDLLGVIRIVGYSLALVAALIAVALYFAGLRLPLVGIFATPFVGSIILGLLVAWITGLSRVLVRRMHFASPQD